MVSVAYAVLVQADVSWMPTGIRLVGDSLWILLILFSNVSAGLR